jgi:uncharacterized protein YdhG (YjbR/CyaY superfamily)
MNTEKPNSITTIDGYIAQSDPEYRQILTHIHTIIREEAPMATEKISYGMPTFHYKENLVHFALAKKHLGFYPTPSGVQAFISELGPYKWSKGAIQFPLDRPIPYDLIRRIVRYRVGEVVGENR